jgi:hypothetical protein
MFKEIWVFEIELDLEVIYIFVYLFIGKKIVQFSLINVQNGHHCLHAHLDSFDCGKCNLTFVFHIFHVNPHMEM